MGLSRFAHQTVAGWIGGSAMSAAPSALKLALSNGDPGETGSGLNEPVGSGYARIDVTLESDLYAPGGTKLTNSGSLVFGPAVDFNWPTLTHGALFGNFSGEWKMILFGPLGVQRTVPVGDTASFGVGALQFVIK